MDGLVPARHDVDSAAPIAGASPALRLVASERDRFEAAYREHRDAVARLLCGRMGREAEVADLVQEAYLRILRYRDSTPESLRLLLFRTALNLAVSHGLRARSRRPHVSLGEVEIVGDLPSPEEQVEVEQRMERLLVAANALPPRCRQIFLLRLIRGLRQQEIAERCGISVRRVEQQLARAQALIREHLRGLAV